MNRRSELESFCKLCGKGFFPYKTSKGIYCSVSCAAKVNNAKRPVRYRKNGNYNCKNCDIAITNGRTYCSNNCKVIWRRQKLVDEWINGADGSDAAGELKATLRNWLVEQAQHRCPKCGWGEVNPTLGKPVLTIDHIDGNYRNNFKSNIEVMCFNCHTLTPTFGSLNFTNPLRSTGRNGRTKKS